MELRDILQKIDHLKEELDALRPIPEEARNRYMQKIRLDWNYHSNSIEGNTLSVNETKQLILYGITAKGKPMRDHIEMQGHNRALHRLEEIVRKEDKITENIIKELHRIILVEPFDGEAEVNPGKYKESSNYLYTNIGERIDFEPPKEVPRLMNELVNWLNNHIAPPKRKKRKYDLHPLLIAAGFHSQFIKIHPFGDGNGRTARILMNLILMMTGYVPAVIKLDDRGIYYSALNQSTLTEMKPLAEFIGEELIKSLELYLKAAKGESIEELSDLDKKLELLKKEIDSDANIESTNDVLTNSSFWNQIKLWGDRLVYDLLNIADKFNDFYDHPNHRFNYMIDGSGNGLHSSKYNKLKDVQAVGDRNEVDRIIKKANINISADYGFCKKGSLTPFECRYDIAIAFSQNHYTILFPEFDVTSGTVKDIEIKKDLHQFLTEEEIEDIKMRWANTLLLHFEYYRKQM